MSHQLVLGNFEAKNVIIYTIHQLKKTLRKITWVT